MRRTARETVGRSTLRVICILLLLLLLALILLTEARRSAEAVGRETADEVMLKRTDSLVGYAFRDEVTVTSTNNGPVEYLVEDGEMVLAGRELARVYTGSQGGTAQREAAAPIYEEIARLEKALEEEMAAWQLSFADSYATLMARVSAGSLSSGLGAAAELSDTLEKRSVLQKDGDTVRVRLATLRAEAAELVRHEDEPHIPVAVENGYFSTATDGREALFGVSAAEGLTVERLNLLLASPSAPPTENIGKLVSAGPFYLAVPVAADKAEQYAVSNVYRIRMTRGGTVEMTLARVELSNTGEALLIFYAERCPAGMDLSRRQSVVIERECVKGISVPLPAVFREGDADFVYVVRDGVAEKRRVRVLCEEQGGCIVATDAGDGYLRVGENLLVTWRSVYEGKVLSR